MRKITWLLLFLVFITTGCYATTAKALETRTETPTDHIITYYDNDIRDDNGKHVGAVYLAVDGTPMINSQYEIGEYAYDGWNNTIKYSCYALDERPMSLSRDVIVHNQKQKNKSNYVGTDRSEMFLLDQYLFSNPLVVFLAVVVLIVLTVFSSQRCQWIMLFIYTLFILYMTLFNRESGEQKVNFEVFWSYKQMISDSAIRREVINNILLFIPFGTLLFSVNPKLLYAIPLLTIVIEVTQYFGGLGLCELDDIFGNTLGGMIGWLILWGTGKVKKKRKSVL